MEPPYRVLEASHVAASPLLESVPWIWRYLEPGSRGESGGFSLDPPCDPITFNITIG